MSRCANALRRALATHGSWMSRAGLGRVTDFSEGRVDDELADLVVAGVVLFNERSREYRLAGSPLARAALRNLLAGSGQRHFLMAPSADKTLMKVGFAMRHVDAAGNEQLLTADLEMPHHQGQPQAIAEFVHALGKFGASPAMANGAAPGGSQTVRQAGSPAP